MFVTPVDSEATLLFVVLRPVDSELRPAAVDVDSALIAVEVEVDSADTLLLVELRPVDSELIPVESDATFVAVDVDRLLTAWFVAFNWLPLIASVLVAET
ncbi:ComM-related protein [Burkholderia sp. AU4i]|nr:ComM-related protein [Burkholderia sp. AU4i]